MKKNVSENPLKTIREIKEYKNKYRLTAEKIHLYLSENNYTEPYNCMTRFRTNITNKDLVNVEAIKKLELVKGLNWNGQELQIIIGGEVVKIVDEFKKYEEDLLIHQEKNEKRMIAKPSLGKRMMGAIAGIMGPSIGILMASGIMGAVYALLTLPNGANILTTSTTNPYWQEEMPDVLKTVAIDMGNLYLFDVWSVIFFVLQKVILNSIGVFFIYNTTKYFKGNPIFALAVGITLMSRGFFPNIGPTGYPIGTSWVDAQFGDWTSNMGKSGFLLFKLGDYPIVVGGYEGAVIPYIVAAIFIVYLDKWIKTWMPSVVDIIFRPTLVYFVALFGVWFLLGPIASLIEYGLITMMQAIGKIPYGFGSALFALLWQPMVLTGCHVAIVMPLITDLAAGNPQILYGAISLGVWGQVGAALGVAMITRNINLRSVAIGGITGGLFGVTEPIIYGVNLLKVRPFFLGCVGGFIGGLVQGNIGTAVVRQGGLGIFGILGYEVWDLPWVLILWTISIGSASLLTVFLYKERKNEYSYFVRAINKLIKLNANFKKEEILTGFKDETLDIKSKKTIFKKVEKYYSKISKYENQLLTINEKEAKTRGKMYQELIKLRNKLSKNESQNLLNKFNELNSKYESFSLDDKKTKVQTELNQILKSNDSLIKEFTIWKENTYNNSLKKLSNYQNEEAVPNMMWNALNAVEVGYGIVDPKNTRFKKKGIN